MNAIIAISTPLRSVTNLPFGPTSFFLNDQNTLQSYIV